MEKYHKQDVAPIEKENERDENYKSDNPQIDSERTRNNYRFTPYFGKTYTESRKQSVAFSIPFSRSLRPTSFGKSRDCNR